MAGQRVNTATIAHVPNFDGVVERPRDDPLPLGVEVQRHDLRRVAEQRVQTFARFYVPQPSRIVHTSRRQHGAVGIEGQTDNFSGMAPVGVI